ncbi:hypothetical protein ACFPM1_01725 [Halorubrum rubrum]|uniref:Restriction endonuclease n=1 Tax=Halorubrum rubrum TaxID=1126240 RepID=A0ABD5QXX4_9EURY|nr:hypothetical protein [Halorubrum rubrum]
MDLSRDGPIGRFRRPEYTGENRCLPCTAVNVAVALAAGAVVGTGVTPAAGAAVVVVSFVAIWLRGYLVPGTPELTKRYLPKRVLALFGKAPTSTAEPSTTDAIDPESYLLSAGVLVETEDGTDLRYAPWFASAWRTRLEDARETDDVAAVTRLAAVYGPDEDLVVEERGNAVFAAVDGERVGHWVSRAAFRADVAADHVLRDAEGDWIELSQPARSTVLGALRLFVEECPTCGGDVAMGEEVVASCCTTHDVVVARCGGCDARLLEIEPATIAAPSD